MTAYGPTAVLSVPPGSPIAKLRPRSFAQAPSKDREQVSGAMDRG